MKRPVLAVSLLVLAASARAAIRVVSSRDSDMARERPVALEFTGEGGKVLKRLDLVSEASDALLGPQDAYDARLCPSGKVLVLTRWRSDPMQRNPYALRRGLTTQISWYGEDGSLLGQRDFPTRTQVAAISDNGQTTILVDGGFQPTDFALYNDVPWIRSTAQLAEDHELIDHRVYAVRPDGMIAFTRVVKGPEAPPSHVVVSPSGRWFLFKLDSPAVYVEDVSARKEDVYARALPLDWRIDDGGQVYGYENQVSGQRKKYVRKPGAEQAVPVEAATAREP